MIEIELKKEFKANSKIIKLLLLGKQRFHFQGNIGRSCFAKFLMRFLLLFPIRV